MRRAVITGLGIVSSIGHDKAQVLESLKVENQEFVFLSSSRILVCVAMFGATLIMM